VLANESESLACSHRDVLFFGPTIREKSYHSRNDDWTHPHDPDAKITKMKDGRTHLAYKAEHAIDLETGAIVGATVQCR
jgi:hypothetical protein